MFESLGDKYIYVAVFAVNIAGFLAGTVLSWTSPELTKLANLADSPLNRIVTEEEKSWLGSLPSVGGMMGPLLFGYLLKKLGRKWTIIFIGLPIFVGYILLSFAANIYAYYVARVLCGVGAAGIFSSGGVYIGEMAESKNRGLLLSSTTCFIIAGILFTYCVGPYISMEAFNIILFIIPVIFVTLVYFLTPESPVYLLTKDQPFDALESLKRLRGSSNPIVNNDFKEMKANIHDEENSVSFFDIFKSKAGRKATLISVLLVVFQQFSGINVILAYTEQIFGATNSSLSASESSIVVGVVQLITCPISPIFSDRFGRRILLIFSIIGGTIASTVLGVYFYLQEDGKNVDSISWLPIVCLVLFIFFFNSGFSSLPWALMAELYPTKVKHIGSGITTFMYWLTGFLLTYFFTDITDGIGMGPTFWMFSAVCVVAVVFVYLYLPETKGKTFQEIEDMLNS